MDIIEFKILNTAIERVLNQELAELDITYMQAYVIGYLNMNRTQEICQKNIEHSLGLTHPTVSSILNRLEEKKLIMTEPLESDRRYKKIVLTDKSSAMTTAIEEKIGKITERIFAGLSMDEIESLSGVIKKLTKNIKLKNLH
ncbi:MarR family winged helix-turn-helix transcriptional regulator [Anaerotignum lactatifermentans]|uniref:MarR family winged helix-turn-helix transcriptional regulator n=1 Tax=Anaerotignum lactatifermentans TaxID=160404 RepID=UPI00242DF87A|nr:MarR family transcriptional regulator [Anaerotignum lactatifermentans]